MADAIEKIGSVTGKGGAKVHKGIDASEEQRVIPNKEKFDQTLEGVKGNSGVAAEHTKVSLMDELRDLNRQVDTTTRATPEQLAQQSKDAIAKIEDLKAKLSAPNVDIKGDYRSILRNKLEHIDENLKVALDKAGIEYVPPDLAISQTATPIEKFLGYLTNGQEQLGTLGAELGRMGQNKESFNPASMLAIQMKVNYVQQEIEFFTSVLNKALESTKTIMNVQV